MHISRSIFALLLLTVVGVASCAEGETSTNAGTCSVDGDCAYLTDPCNVGICDPQTQTCYSQAHVGAVCDDGDDCTSDDACTSQGECAGEPYTCEASNPCMESVCAGDGTCDENVRADKCLIGGACYDDQEDNPADPCQWCDSLTSHTEWQAKPVGTVCSEPSEACDPSACDAQGQCVSQGFAPEGTACGAAAAPCEQQMTCDGAGHCMVRGPQPDTHVCRPSTNDCDPAETCDGVNTTCPADVTLGDGDDCGICRRCNASGQCVENSDDHDDCTECMWCSSGSCVNQPAGADEKNECSVSYTCTDVIMGPNGASCHAYQSSTGLSEACNGNGACADASDSCQGQGTAVATCADAGCLRCTAGAATSTAGCYADLLRHGCSTGYVCDTGGACVLDPGSCPFLYTWDGSEFAFETDMYGSGKLGVKLGGGFWNPTPMDYYVLNHVPAELNGALELRLVEERSEVNYLDLIELLAVEVPDGLKVMTELHGLGTPYTTLEDSIHTVVEPLQVPLAATHVNSGASVLPEVSASDGVYAILNSDRNLDFEYQTIELDLGDLSGAPQIKLIIDGRTAFPISPAGIARKALFGAPSRLEVVDGSGAWVEVPQSVAKLANPKEARRPFVMDISAIFPTNDYRVRLTWLFKTYVDALLLDTSLDVSATLQPLPLESADLHYYGHSLRVGGELFEFVYGSINQDLWPPFPGYYTRFGDVAPLLDATDDMFVIFWAGDEVALRFTQLPPPASGTTRHYIFHTHGYYKAVTYTGAHEVEPLPFNAMSNYPYPDTEHYPNDYAHKAYRDDYNTRYMP